MAMLKICAADGCNTKTLGSHCLQHESVLRLQVVEHRRPQAAVKSLARVS